MSKNKHPIGNVPENENVISIVPFLKSSEEKTFPNSINLNNHSDLLFKFMDMNTDDIAGSILAHYIFDITLFEDIDSAELLEELKDRAIAYLDLYEQIKLNL
jgi:hypothetical protein